MKNLLSIILALAFSFTAFAAEHKTEKMEKVQDMSQEKGDMKDSMEDKKEEAMKDKK